MQYRLLLTLILLITLLAPTTGRAAFIMPSATPVITHQHYLPAGRDRYRHMHSFRGHRHTFFGVLGLTCSVIGSVSVVACLAAAIATGPVSPLIAAAYIANIAGIIFGCIAHSDPAGSTAILLGLANLLAFYLGAAIYSAANGNFLPLLKLLRVFVK